MLLLNALMLLLNASFGFQAGSSFCENRPEAQLVAIELDGSEASSYVDIAVSITPILLHPASSPSPNQQNGKSAFDSQLASQSLDSEQLSPSSATICVNESVPEYDVVSGRRRKGHIDPNDAATAVSYLVRFPDVPGKFDVKRAAAAGVPAGPMYGRLKSGHAVTLSCGRVVRPEECVEGGAAGDVLAVIECPSVEHLGSLVRHGAWRHPPPPPTAVTAPSRGNRAGPAPDASAGGATRPQRAAEWTASAHAAEGEEGCGATIVVHLAPQVCGSCLRAAGIPPGDVARFILDARLPRLLRLPPR